MPQSTVEKFSDLPKLVGYRYRGEPFSITREERDEFERVTWIDRAYPDLDPDGFPEDIVEGFHSLSLLDAVSTLAGLPVPKGMITGYNYGLDKVRFTAQIKIGDTIDSLFEIRDVRERGPGFLLLRHCEFTVQGHEGPALVADWWGYLLPTVLDD